VATAVVVATVAGNSAAAASVESRR